ncbi:hypothetical protein [Microbacterium rhizophilus]|uniref:hypothetical protein n=1 Tax=Microbacterium rhizophilus TaxID=3138934 RepID=UPI0031F0D178
MLVALVGLAIASLGAVILGTYRRDRLAAFVGVPVISLVLLVPTFYVENQTIKNVALLVIIGASVALFALRPAHPRGMWLLIAYFGVLLLSTLLHPAVAEIGAWVTVALPALAVVVVMVSASPGEVTTIARFIIGLSTAEAAYAVLEMLRIAPRLWGNSVSYPHQILPGLVRGEGTLGQPLMLALLLLLALTLTLGKSGPRGARRVAIAAVLIAGLVATGSRSALIVAVAVILFSIGGKLWTRIAVGMFSALTLVVYLAASGFFTGSIVQNFLTGDSVSHRSGALEAIPKLLGQTPGEVLLGSGHGSTARLFGQGLLQSGSFYAIDNQLVSTLATGGVVALALLVIAIVHGFRIGAGSRIPLVAVVVLFLTFDVLAWPAGAALFSFAMGLALAARMPARESDHNTSTPTHLRDEATRTTATRPLRSMSLVRP